MLEQTQPAIQILIRAFSALKRAHFTIFDISCCWVRFRGTPIVKNRDFPPPLKRGTLNQYIYVKNHLMKQFNNIHLLSRYYLTDLNQKQCVVHLLYVVVKVTANVYGINTCIHEAFDV